MEVAKLGVLFVVLVFLSRIDAVPFSTEIQPEPDYMGRAVIILPEEENATVMIQCVPFQSGQPRETVWFVQLPGASMAVAVTELSSQFTRSGFANRDLTIFNITQDLDRTEILCGPGDTQLESRFLLGFEATAQLISAGVMPVREGEDISVSLEANGNSPFSPLVTFQWIYNGADLNSSQRISLDNYSISITGVQRGDAGDYQLNVSNNAGFGVGNFTLDVQFSPNATDVSVSPLYFIVGTDVTLIAFVNIEGNPEPSSVWTLNSNALSDVRFDTSVPGQLSITNISSADEGAYICTLASGDFAFDVSATIQLDEAVLPSMPQNIAASEVNSTSARLAWDAPSTPGQFGVSFYRVRVMPSLSNEVIETSMTETFLTGLLPGTEYMVTVAAVVNDTSLLSEGVVEIESLSAVFNTSVSAPLFDNVTFANEEGFITISWVFVHTGGLPITTVESFCTSDDGASGSGYDLMRALTCTEMDTCSDESMTGSLMLGPVEAGANYTCTVTAFNANGSDVAEGSDLTSDIGIPSTPLIREANASPGRVVLTVETVSPGGPVVNFNVTTSPLDSTEEETMVFPVSNDNAVAGADLTVYVPNGGSYTFTVITFNSFGTLGITDSMDVMDVPPAVSTSTPGITTSTPSQSTAPTSGGEPATTNTPTQPSSGGLSGGAVAGIVIAILIISALIVLIVLVVIYLYIKNRGESYQVDKSQSKGTVKMAEVEVDIGKELDSRPSGESEKPKPNEVQYADLEHFRKKEQTPDDTTPLASSSAAHPAVEPVTYSVIQPQLVKPENGTSQPNAAEGSDATSI